MSSVPHRYLTRSRAGSINISEEDVAIEMAPQEDGPHLTRLSEEGLVEMAPQEDQAQLATGGVPPINDGQSVGSASCSSSGLPLAEHPPTAFLAVGNQPHQSRQVMPTDDVPNAPLPNKIELNNSHHPDHDASRRQYRLRGPTRQQPKQWGYIGDNCIETSGCHQNIIAMMARGPHLEANFIRKMWSMLVRNQPNVRVQNNAIQVTSCMIQSEQQGAFREPIRIVGDVCTTSNGPLPAAQVVAPRVIYGEGYVTETLPQQEIDKYLHGNVPSEKIVTSALGPKLQVNNQRTMRALADLVDKNTTCCVNSGLYAKLIWNALLLDVFERLGEMPQANPFPLGFNLNWIDLDVAELPFDNIATPVIRKDIIMLAGSDFRMMDLQLVYWLAKPGSRLTGIGHQRIPHGAYVQWPGIPITVLAHGPAPVEPQAEIVTSAALLAFASNLADIRHEWDSFETALYWVMDNIFIQLVQLPGEPWRHITPMFSTRNLSLPKPQDYNIFLRILGINPILGSQPHPECIQWIQTLSNMRVDISVVYSACLSTFTTTTLYSMQLDNQSVVNWTFGLHVDATTAGIFQIINSTKIVPGGTSSSVMFDMVKCCFTLFLGLSVNRKCRWGDNWLGTFGADPMAADVYNNYPMNIPIRFFNPLVIDEFVSVRPLEWGLTDPNPQVDFTKEVRTRAGDGWRGWFAHVGDRGYFEAAKSTFPYRCIPYGAFGANVIAQNYRLPAFHLNATLVPLYTLYECVVEGIEPLVGPVYMPALCIFEPCTIMNFDPVRNLIKATAVVDPNIQQRDIFSLQTINCKLGNVGFSRVLQPLVSPYFAAMPGMSDSDFRVVAPSNQVASATLD